MQRLRKEGADSDNLDRTLAAYQRALEICDNYGYESNATELNRDIAAVYLKKKEYELALRHATECIHLDAQFGEVGSSFNITVYVLRAGYVFMVRDGGTGLVFV